MTKFLKTLNSSINFACILVVVRIYLFNSEANISLLISSFVSGILFAILVEGYIIKHLTKKAESGKQ